MFAGLSGPAGRSDETMMLNGLSVIAEHAALRVDNDMMHPSLFPIDHMFRLLIDLISEYCCTQLHLILRTIKRLHKLWS